MRKKTLLAAVFIAALVGFGGIVFTASAAQGFWGGMMDSEWRQNMKNAQENNDYGSWRNLVQERHDKMLEWMSPERFSKMNEMRRLMRERKTDEANKIRQELGIPEWNGKKGAAGGKMQGKNGNWRGNCWR